MKVTTIILKTHIDAPPDVCFDLMRDIRLHAETMDVTDERAVAGVTEGKIGLGQTVTFEGTHFGMRQRMTVEVVEFDRPNRFVDEMTEGRFKTFKHIHEFTASGRGTVMTDNIAWKSPLGIVGRLADILFIQPHLTSLVTNRNARLKAIAEASVSDK